jgi:hypothetical protein
VFEVHSLPAVLSREIIAKLPPEVSEVAKMEDLTTVAEGESLLAQVTVIHWPNRCQVSTLVLFWPVAVFV